MTNSRITNIDAIRRLAMLFVVYGHVNYFAFGITAQGLSTENRPCVD